MFFIFAWCLKDEASFNEAVPLDLLAESWRRHGSSLPITVVLLEGHASLSPGYLAKLQAMGLRFVDFTDGFRDIVAAFPNLNAAYSHYERNCFLRWIAFEDVRTRLGISGQVWHLDGDVILHASTDDIAADTASKTFVLQGCPVLVSISHPDWFPIYRRELRALEADITGYSATAAEAKPVISQRNRELCNVTPYRNPIGSDQDLLEYLVSAEILPQDSSGRVFDSRFYFIQNALLARYWDDLQSPGFAGQVAETAGGELRYGPKTIPFIHYQNQFCQYGAVYLAFAQWGLQRFTPAYTNPRKGEGDISFFFRLTFFLMRKAGFRVSTRREIVLKLSDKSGEGTRRLVDAVNHINFRGRA